MTPVSRCAAFSLCCVPRHDALRFAPMLYCSAMAAHPLPRCFALRRSGVLFCTCPLPLYPGALCFSAVLCYFSTIWCGKTCPTRSMSNLFYDNFVPFAPHNDKCPAGFVTDGCLTVHKSLKKTRLYHYILKSYGIFFFWRQKKRALQARSICVARQAKMI